MCRTYKMTLHLWKRNEIIYPGRRIQSHFASLSHVVDGETQNDSVLEFGGVDKYPPYRPMILIEVNQRGILLMMTLALALVVVEVNCFWQWH